jgi:gp20 (fragment)|nr:MAG TPA: capsid assembly protein [Ackermannviridae sp.]
MANKLTVFQQLDKAITGNWNTQDTMARHINNYDMSGNNVIYQTNDKDNYEKVKLELQQNKYLENRWVKANVDLNVSAYSGLNNVKLMYRDADLMDSFPEIGAALDIVSEESCLPSDTGNIVNVYSKSDRVKSILEDLFTNRLNLQLTAQMVIRGMCKYGNDYMMLDIDHKLGVKGWKRLPVFNVERIENGITNPYSTGYSTVADNNTDTNSDMSTKFVWLDDSQSQVPFRDWQIAHFRLLTNSMYLPYGVSYLNSARRHWRMLSLMEDMMLIYRLERSIERRVYKIFVGAIDDADVPAYVEEIANNFKRTPIIDPMTGQVDLRKNILPVHKDTPIPLLDGRTITIENLAKEYENGKENFVYSVQDDTHKIVPGKVVWCGKNYTADKLYRITLDDDTYLDLAGEHELIMRDGSKKRADEVSVGESVMPFYRDDTDYDRVLDISSKSYRKVTLNDSSKNESEPVEVMKLRFIRKVDIIGGDDVYCMTVQGPNGEEDRHNFAIRSINSDKTWCENGCFVSNCVDQDIFIPVRDQNAPTPIDTLSAAQNLTAMDDIKFVQNKVLTALRIPKTFLNFEETAGDGKNLALMDIRFTRTVNRVQQAFLMELTKVASIHLFLLGFSDELTNFSLTMNNPSTQAESLEIDNIEKKITAVRDAVSDPGGGIPVMSQAKALKTIMKWSDKEIKENLEEIRLEKGISAELEKTTQIIKRTGLFDTVDRIYGEPGAEYMDDQPQQGGPDGGMGGGSMGGGGDFGGGLDSLGAPGSDDMGDIGGEEGSMPTGDMGGDAGAPPGGEAPGSSGPEAGGTPMESVNKKKPLITENTLKAMKKNSDKKLDTLFEDYLNCIDRKEKKAEEISYERANIYDKSLLINEEFDKMISSLDNLVNENE